jgi:hypothetical protein
MDVERPLPHCPLPPFAGAVVIAFLANTAFFSKLIINQFMINLEKNAVFARKAVYSSV